MDVIKWIVGYLLGELDGLRQEKFREWLEQKPEHRLFLKEMCEERTFLSRWRQREKIDPERAIRAFDRRTKVGRRSVLMRWMPYAAAVVVSFAAGISFWALNGVEESVVVAENEVIQPGEHKAILILSDGKRVNLQNRDSLTVNLGEGSQAVNKNNGLVYQGNAATCLQYHELQVPFGGEYRVTLADGTVVHLNSASSLTYPVVFGNDSRKVKLSGEAYFEVAKGDTPFYVEMNGLAVRVYGTCFNINGHFNEHIQTALVEGKVSILVNEKEYLMKPSQLADFDLQTGKMDIRDADLSAIIAWTKGLFVFENRTLGEIMQILSQWYDVEPCFQDVALQKLHFTGSVERYEQIDVILRALSGSVGVKINKQGRKLTIGYEKNTEDGKPSAYKNE